MGRYYNLNFHKDFELSTCKSNITTYKKHQDEVS